MKYKTYLLALALISAFLTPLANAATGKPNVILILADDLGFETIGANGGQSYKTPNLDRLAATGMRFENCHVQPLCTPTRVQLMTGLYNVRNYVDFGFMEPDSVTFANLFKKKGYKTCIAGKWQLGRELNLPKKWGFDEYCLWQFTRVPERYKNPGLEINGKEVDYTKGEYGPDIVSDYALDFIARNKDVPFLLYYPMMLTHSPFVPTPDHPDYNNPNVSRKGKDEPKYFGAMVSYMDKLIGKLADKLDELNLRENTLILFVGDNGTGTTVSSQFRGKPFQGGKGDRTAAGTHVPLIANWPGVIPAGCNNSNLVDSTDFFPTMCDAAGIAIARDSYDGESFWPQLQGKNGSPRQWSYSWYCPRGGPTKFEFAQDLNFKLYRDGTFVNVKADPDEKKPIETKALKGEAAASYAKLKAVLDDYAKARPAKYLPAKADEKSEDKKVEKGEKPGKKRAGKKKNK